MATTTKANGFFGTDDGTIYFVTPAGDVYYVQGPDDADIPVLFRERLPEGATPADLDPGLAAEYLDALRAATVDVGTTPQARVLELISWESANDFSTTDLVKEYFNCQEARVDEAGDIWIEGPQAGHWLSEEKIEAFLAFVAER